MEISFVDNWLYKITLPIFIGIFIWVVLSFKARTFLKKHQRLISILFALLCFGNSLGGEIAYGLNGNFNLMFFADLCPFSVTLSVPLMIVNKEKYFKMFMPWLIIGGLATFGTSTLGIQSFNTFIGFNSFERHALMLLEGTFIYGIVSKYSKADFWSLLILPGVLIVWILLTLLPAWLITGDDDWAVYSTGLFKPGYTRFYEHLSDGWILNMLDVVAKTYPLPSFVFYAIAVSLAMLIAWTKKFDKKRSRL